MANEATTASFTILTGAKAEVLGEGRTLTIESGRFQDGFSPYAVHLYRIR